MMTIMNHKDDNHKLADKMVRGITPSLILLLMMAWCFRPSHAETLLDALALTYQSNPEIEAQRASLRATDEGVAQALGGYRPSFSLGYSANYDYINYDNAQTTTSDTDRTISLAAEQNLYDFGKTKIGIEAAEDSVTAGRANLLNVEQSILLQAASAYLSLLQNQAILTLREKNLVRLQYQNQAAQDRFQVGEVTKTDVGIASSRLAQARADLVSAKGALQISMATYMRVVGHEPSQLSENINTIEIPLNMPASRETLIEQSLLYNPELATSRYVYHQALSQAKAADIALYPDVSFSASLSQADNVAGRGVESHGYALGVNLSVPLYQSGIVAAQARAAKSSAVSAMHQLSATRKNVIETAHQAWERYHATLSLVEALLESLQASQLVLEGTEQEAMLGLRTVLDVLDAEQDVMDDEVNLVSAKHDLILAKINIAVSLGNFHAKALNLPVTLYDPHQHYLQSKQAWFGHDAEQGVYQPKSSVIGQ